MTSKYVHIMCQEKGKSVYVSNIFYIDFIENLNEMFYIAVLYCVFFLFNVYDFIILRYSFNNILFSKCMNFETNICHSFALNVSIKYSMKNITKLYKLKIIRKFFTFFTNERETKKSIEFLFKTCHDIYTDIEMYCFVFSALICDNVIE